MTKNVTIARKAEQLLKTQEMMSGHEIAQWLNSNTRWGVQNVHAVSQVLTKDKRFKIVEQNSQRTLWKLSGTKGHPKQKCERCGDPISTKKVRVTPYCKLCYDELRTKKLY